jgi:hypothetical protein
MGERGRRAGDEIVVPVFLAHGERSIEVADGTVVGFGFRVFLDRERSVELVEDDQAPVLPGIFHTQVAGVSFHDDVLQLPHFGAGRKVEIRPEPANESDRNALAVCSDGLRVGYLPAPIADVLAPAGTRVGRGMVVMEWSTNGERRGISVLGSMHVNLAVSKEE